jgi:hypothetical protein
MGLLAAYRYFWAPILLATLLLAGIAHVAPLLLEAAPRQSFVEAIPAAPSSGKSKDWRDWGRRFQEILTRAMTSASPLWHANAWIRRTLRSPLGGKVVYGRDGWLFYTGENVFEQSAGQLKRPDYVEQFAAMAAVLNRELARRGAQLIVTVAPNSQTIYPEFLPDWAQINVATTEYDLVMDALARHGVAKVDLRPPLLAAKLKQQVYRRIDTHWNDLGALIAYNAIMEAIGWPEWRWDPDKALKGFERRAGGGLLRLLGIADGSSGEGEDVPTIDVGAEDTQPAQVWKMPDSDLQLSYVIETGRPGPTVVVIGDSFTRLFFRPFLIPHVGRLVWTRSQICGFDWDTVSRYDPALVILIPTERQLVCPPDRWPLHLPKS